MKNSELRKKPIKRRSTVSKIFIAHDHKIVRIGLRALLKGRRGLRICGEASTSAATLKGVEKLQPDILLLKLDLPDKGALVIMTKLLNLRPGLKVLIFSAEGPTEDAQLAVLTPTVARRALGEGRWAWRSSRMHRILGSPSMRL
jgi:CheY-like chemotaxis protein